MLFAAAATEARADVACLSQHQGDSEACPSDAREAPVFIVEKTVHFIRHGLAQHNVGSAGCYDFEVYDARLVDVGTGQAMSLGGELSKAGVHADAIITSPLWRTLQTTSFLLKHGWGDDRSSPDVFVMEDAREHFTACTDNARGTTSRAAAAFPGFHFDPLASNRDPMLVGGEGIGQYESSDDLHERAARFLNALRNRAESNIIVVSHGTFIGAALVQAEQMGWARVSIPRLSEHVIAQPGQFFGNCQVASVELRSSSE